MIKFTLLLRFAIKFEIQHSAFFWQWTSHAGEFKYDSTFLIIYTAAI